MSIGKWFRKCNIFGAVPGPVAARPSGKVAGADDCCCCLCACDICQAGTTPAWVKIKVVANATGSPPPDCPWDGLEITCHKTTHGKCCSCFSISKTCCDYAGVAHHNGYGFLGVVTRNDPGGGKYGLLMQAIEIYSGSGIGSTATVFDPDVYGTSKMDCGDWLGAKTGEIDTCKYTIEIIQLGPMTNEVCCESCQDCPLTVDYEITSDLCGCIPPPAVIDAGDGTNVRIQTSRNPRCKCPLFAAQFNSAATCSYREGTATYSANVTIYFVNEFGTLRAVGVLRMAISGSGGESFSIYEGTISGNCLPEGNITLSRVAYREVYDPEGVLEPCPGITLTFSKVYAA